VVSIGACRPICAILDRQPFPYLASNLPWSGLFGSASLNMLTFLVIGIAHSLDNLTDLLIAAVHRLADSLRTGALLERSGNPISRRLRIPHCVAVSQRRFTASQWQKGIVHIQTWRLLDLNITLGSWPSGP
jgi:hypothetical protein